MNKLLFWLLIFMNSQLWATGLDQVTSAELQTYQEYSVESHPFRSTSRALLDDLKLELLNLSVNSDKDEFDRPLTQVELNYLMRELAVIGASHHEIEQLMYSVVSELSQELETKELSDLMKPLKLVRDLKKAMLTYENHDARCYYTTGVTFDQVLEPDSPMLDPSKIRDEKTREDFKIRPDEYIVVGKCRGFGVIRALKNW